MIRILCLLLFAQSLFAEQIIVESQGLDNPSGIVYFPQREAYLVANLKGGENVPDNYADITMISDPFTERAQEKGVKYKVMYANTGKKKGLSSPSKMILHKDDLLVLDYKQLAIFSAVDGVLKPKKLIPLPKSGYLRSMVLGHDGKLYISDSEKNKIYVIATPFAEDAKVELLTDKIMQPMGLAYIDGLMYVSSPRKNLLYVYDCVKNKPVKTMKLAKNNDYDGLGFTELAVGNENEIYLFHADRESLFLYNIEWEGVRGAKVFKENIGTVNSMFFSKDNNSLMISDAFANHILIEPALKSRP